MSAALRQAAPPLVSRIEEEHIIIDLITLTDENPKTVAAVIAYALKMDDGSMAAVNKPASNSEGDSGLPA